jgi:prepilin-type N-terminal cleavage/methylation domain-containing protein
MQTLNIDRRQRGFSLAEIVVAVAVFAMIFLAVLALYDTSNKDFKSGVERSEMQQNVRVAYEKLVAEVRQAGFDYDRDGFPSGAGGQAWQKSKVYGVGNVVSPITANGFTYTVTQQGTSGTTEPSWSTTVGGITNDGTVKWRTDPGINQYQQPDEQVEFAHRRALTFRANFDYETDPIDTATGRVINGRELTLQTSQFPVVTTGNDEIVTYALRSVNGPNPDKVEFYADVPDRRTHPGGRAENLVSIQNVDLCTTGVCTSPPYNLIRFTLRPNGTVDDSAVIATNVREIEFTYYNDAVGTSTPLAFTPALANTAGSSGGGQYNPNLVTTGAEARGRRAEIKAIRINLTGMNSSRDGRYINPREPVGSAARNYRTYSLESLVVPRNLGKMGVREQAEAPPGEPQLASVEVNWCGGVRVKWQAPPAGTGATGDVDQYIVIYDVVSPPVRFQKQVGPATEAFVDDLDPTLRYYFTVAAVNSFGTTVARNDATGDPEFIPATGPGLQVRNKTTPEPPENLLASGGDVAGSPAIQKNRITLSWDNPLLNIAGQDTTTCFSLTGACTGKSGVEVPVIAGELQKYEILRSKDPDFDPDDPDEYELVSTIAPNKLQVGPSASTFEDNTAVACVDYYYRIRLVERCNPPTASNNVNPGKPYSDYYPAEGTPAIKGRAEADARPSAPTSLVAALTPLQATALGIPESNTNAGFWANYLQWTKVTTDVTTKPITVETYVITRRQMKGATVIDEKEWVVTDSTPASGQYFTSGGSDNPWYRDPDELPLTDPNDGLQYQYVYTVRARLACTPELDSDESPELKIPCPYTGGAVDITAGGMADGNGLTLATAWLTDAAGSSSITATPAGTVQSVQVLLISSSSTGVINLGTKTAPPFTFGIGSSETGEIYRAYVITKDANGCQNIDLRFIEEGTQSGCCLAAYADNPLVVQYSPGSSFVDVQLENQCGNDLQIQTDGISIAWDKTITASGTKLVSIEYAGETGGRITQTVNDATGLVKTSLPVGARNPIRAGETVRVQLQFNTILTNANSPLQTFCVSYQRAGVDLANQNCRIVPDALDPALNPACTP